jgi:hypothetical protein
MIAKALTEAIAVSGPPGDTARLPHRSEQYWLQAFSTPGVTAEQMRHFLASFQFVRDKCDYEEAADLVNELIRTQDFDPLSDIETIAGALRAVTDRRTPQTVAATAICMFAKPSAKVFVMGDLHCYSARLALWERSGRAVPPLLGVPFHDDGWEVNGSRGTEDYPAYAQASEAVLEGVVEAEAFKNALNRYLDYLESVQGPMRLRENAPIGFVERRLLEKLMACEGWYIRYWLENEAQTGRLAPSDEGIMVSRVVPRRPQDVFPRELAEKFGY